MTDFIFPYVEVICYEKGLCFLHEICSCDESVFAQRFPVLFLERQKTKHYFWKMHDNLNFSLMIVWRGIYCFNNCYFWLSDIYGFYLLWLQCNLSYIWMFLAIYGSSVAVFSHITYIKIVWGCNLNMYELSDLFEIDIFSSIGSNFDRAIYLNQIQITTVKLRNDLWCCVLDIFGLYINL